MKKNNFIVIIMGTVGGIFFSLGMCMCLLSEWNIFIPGVVIGCIGLMILSAMLPVFRKLKGKAPFRFNSKTIKTILLGIGGVLLLGVGMSLTMVWNYFVFGIAIGITGIVLLLVLIPLIRGLR